MNLRKIKNATIISCIALVVFVLSSCNEDSIKPTDSENNFNLPTVPPPSGGWTTEEQALITEFGSITEVTPSNDWLTYGYKISASLDIDLGRHPECDQILGICGHTWSGITVTWDNTTKGINYDIQITFSQMRMAVPDSTNGLTTNGLFVIEDYLPLDEYMCEELGYASCIVQPGLYIADFTDSSCPNGIVYFNVVTEALDE